MGTHLHAIFNDGDVRGPSGVASPAGQRVAAERLRLRTVYAFTSNQSGSDDRFCTFLAAMAEEARGRVVMRRMLRSRRQPPAPSVRCCRPNACHHLALGACPPASQRSSVPHDAAHSQQSAATRLYARQCTRRKVHSSKPRRHIQGCTWGNCRLAVGGSAALARPPLHLLLGSGHGERRQRRRGPVRRCGKLAAAHSLLRLRRGPAAGGP